jgi:hypothetical protein
MKTLISLIVLMLVAFGSLAQAPDKQLAEVFCYLGHSTLHSHTTSQTSNQPSSKHVVVNGRVVRGGVWEIDGKNFVAVEDLAQSLGGTVGYSGEQISLTLPSDSLDVQSSHLSSTQLARIKGTLTYFFNSNSGNKPDTGSDVWLVEGHVAIPSNEFLIDFSGNIKVGIATYVVVKHTVADGSGNFDLSQIPPGLYTLVMRSNHTKGAYGAMPKDAVTSRDLNGRVMSQEVQLKPGETIDASKDFGVNAF